MNISKAIGKTSLALAAATALTLIAGPAHSQASESFTLTLIGKNATSVCVRFFVNGEKDVPAGQTWELGKVPNGTSFKATVLSKTCGGSAARDVWFTTASRSADVPKGKQTWTVK